jgi:hypothetical protein
VKRVPVSTALERVDQTAADKRRLERARRERERRIAEHGARILATLRQSAPWTDRLGA